MTRISLAFAASAAVLVALLPPTPAQALFRTYVSRGGSDANNCDLPTPCLTMGRAVQQTTSGGIASCLDSNDYTQTVTIDKSMTVDCASVPGTSAAGPFIINTPGVKVTIKNVVIFVNGSPGISFTDGASLVVENCFIRNNPVGISFAPTAVGAKLVVTDTLIKDNTGAGILVQASTGGLAFATIQRVTVTGNGGAGITGNGNNGGGAHISVRDSLSTFNLHGYTAATNAAGVVMKIDRSEAALNTQYGVLANGPTAVAIGYSTIMGNTTGLASFGGGQILSSGNNINVDNGTNGAPTGVSPLQ